MKEILERAKKIIRRPGEAWPIIKNETSSVQELFINYAAPLALIPAVATLIGLAIVGIRMPSGNVARAPFMEALTGGVVGYVFHLLGLLAAAYAVNFLTSYFNSKSDLAASAKLVIYSMTPIWLLGLLSALPGLGVFQIFGLYGIYLLNKGLPVLLETPPEKTAWFTTVIVLLAILISLIMTVTVGGAVYGPMFLRMMSA